MITQHRISTYSSLIISGALVLVAVVLYGFTLFSITKAENRVNTLAVQLATDTEMQKNEHVIEKTIDTIKQERTMLDTHFIVGEDAAHFLETLEGYGKTAQTTFTLLDANVDKDQKTILVSFKAQGGFADIYQLIVLIENAPYLLSIEKVTLAASDKAETTPSLSSSTTNDLKSSGSKQGLWEGNFIVRLSSFVQKK